ncbi:ParM/StbA family protein [Paenibacillus sp. FSL P4-0176]|uniref:ParM/StbA family protein n=1 Tax=Paenibacillus sp. FSL P4-0176 TaxID=2921631 RepID=UPI0030CB6E4F
MFNTLNLDLGFKWTKAERGGKFYRQPTIVGEAKDMFEQNIKSDHFIYNDELFVGNVALEYSDIKYFSLNNKKAEAETSDVVMKTTLGYLARKDRVKLVSGLPINFYFTQKESFKEKLLGLADEGEYTIRKGRGKNFTVQPIVEDCKMVPQGLGVTMDYLLDEDGRIAKVKAAQQKILTVDLGFYTLNLLGFSKSSIMKESKSVLVGVERAYTLLQGYIQKLTGHTPAIYELDPYVISGQYQGHNIVPLIQRAFKSLASQIKNEIESLNTEFDIYLIAGGAARYIYEYLNLPNKVLMDQLAQVRGYGKIGKKSWK